MMRLPLQFSTALAALVVSATVAPVSASPRAGNAIQRIQVREASDQTVVEIESQAKPTFTVFKLADPPRLFVDVVGADVSALEATMNVSNGVIRNPPPTPNRPERKPTAAPSNRKTGTDTDISAIGR